MSTRIIHRSAARPHRLIAEALQSLVVGELLSPGTRLLVVSPWISDVPLVDNRSGRFSCLDLRWGAQWIPLSDVMRSLLAIGVRVQVVCGPGPREDEFLDRLVRAAHRDGTEGSLLVRRSLADRDIAMDHEKAIVADTWAVHGSMNLTYRGVELNGELVTVTDDASHVASVATELLSLFT